MVNIPKTSNEMLRICLAEFLGTFTLVFLGCSVNASGKLNAISSFLGPFGWGLSLTAAIAVSINVSGGHVNPAVSLGLATIGKLSWKKLPFYFIGQYVGAFFGSLLCYLIYNQSITHFQSNWEIFGTAAQDQLNVGSTILDNIVSTMFFLMLICAITDSKTETPKYLVPLLIGFTDLSIIAMATGYNCGAAVNPARDLMPRIMSAMVGWGDKPFSHKDYAYFWVPPIFCHVGGVLGCWIYKLFITIHYD